MYFRKFKLRFVDTYKFFLSPLADLSKTYGIDTVKGFFPHHFNLPENQNYVGRYPSIEYYGPKNMSPDKVAEFNKWYSGVKNDVFDFKNEFKKYCLADVELLAKAILKYRHIFKTTKDLDPFRYVTLPSMTKDMFLNKYLPDDTIVGNGGSKPISQVCREWLIHTEAQDVVPEVPLTVNNIPDADYFKMFGSKTKRYYKKPCHTFTVDAFDRKTKTVKEFNGCYFHGCPKCNPARKDRYLQSCERRLILEQAGYQVQEMWECDWKTIKATLPNKKELEAEAKAQNINIRDALFGGRTECFKSYHKCIGKQVINYDDVTSLFPTVNALDDYAVGFKKTSR